MDVEIDHVRIEHSDTAAENVLTKMGRGFGGGGTTGGQNPRGAEARRLGLASLGFALSLMENFGTKACRLFCGRQRV